MKSFDAPHNQAWKDQSNLLHKSQPEFQLPIKIIKEICIAWSHYNEIRHFSYMFSHDLKEWKIYVYRLVLQNHLKLDILATKKILMGSITGLKLI